MHLVDCLAQTGDSLNVCRLSISRQEISTHPKRAISNANIKCKTLLTNALTGGDLRLRRPLRCFVDDFQGKFRIISDLVSLGAEFPSFQLISQK